MFGTGDTKTDKTPPSPPPHTQDSQSTGEFKCAEITLTQGLKYPLYNNVEKMEWELRRGFDPFTLSFEDRIITDRNGSQGEVLTNRRSF